MHDITRGRALTGLAAGAAAIAVPTIARAATPLSVGQIGNNSVAFFPLYVAKTEGYFRDAGLDVTITAFQSGTLVGTAVTSGSLDIGASVITDVFALLKANRPVKIVGSLVNGYYVDIIASNQLLAATKLTRASKLNEKIKALKGKRVGITGPGSGTEALLMYLLKSQSIDPTRDLEIVNVGADQASILTTMKTGRIDAVSFAWPLSMVAEAQNIGKALISPAGGDVSTMRDQLQGVMYVREDALAKREEATIAFVRAIGRAEALLHKDGTKARALLKGYDAQLSDPAIDRLLEAYLPVLPTAPRCGVINYDKALAFHRTVGYAPATGASFQDIVSTSTIDKAVRS